MFIRLLTVLVIISNSLSISSMYYIKYIRFEKRVCLCGHILLIRIIRIYNPIAFSIPRHILYPIPNFFRYLLNPMRRYSCLFGIMFIVSDNEDGFVNDGVGTFYVITFGQFE